MRQRLLVICNPVPGGKKMRRLDRVLCCLREGGAELDLREGHARSIASEVDLAGIEAVVAAGGDGTLNEIVNGLLARADVPPPLGLIPVGTASVVARELAVPLNNVSDVARIILNATPTPIHLGRANGRAFVQMVGVGFDADVVEGVDLDFKRRFGRSAYVWQTLVEASRHRRRALSVETDGRRRAATSVVILNGRYYGGPYICAKNARLTEPGLHAFLLRRSGRVDNLRYGWGMLSGRLARFPDVEVIKGRHFHIESEVARTPPEPVQGDGDVIARLPLDVDLHKRTLSVLMGSLAR